MMRVVLVLALALALAACASAVKRDALPVIARFDGIEVLASDEHAVYFDSLPAGAKIEDVSLALRVTDRRRHTVAIAHVELVDDSCDTTQAQQRTPLRITGHALYEWTNGDPVARGERLVTIAAGRPQQYAVSVAFPSFEVYGDCSTFAFDVDVDIDGVRGKYVVPLHVEREIDDHED